MSNGILVFAEHRGSAISKTTYEALAAAQSLGSELGQEVSAVVLGSGMSGLANELTAYQLTKIVYAENVKLADYTPDGYTDAMERVVRQLDPQFVILPHTYLVRDFAPKLSARFGKGLISDCLRARVANGAVTFTRRIFLGKIDADVVAEGEPPIFATFQSGAYRGDQALKGSGAQVETMNVEVGEVRMKPEAPFQEVKQAVDLTKADIIVAIGRGIKSKENIALAEQLAAALGGDLAASRPICDAEWLPLDREVVVCSMGPQRVKSVIKDALARGADRAIHVVADDINHLSPYAAASVLAEAVRGEQADLILTGLQSDDHGFAQTGVIMAELLGLPHATIVIEVDASGEELRVKRELESGWYQWYAMEKPALLTIQSGISQIRYATLKGIMAAKKKEIKEVAADGEAAARPSNQRIEKIYFPEKTKQTQFLGNGDAKAGATALAEKLRNEARVF